MEKRPLSTLEFRQPVPPQGFKGFYRNRHADPTLTIALWQRRIRTGIRKNVFGTRQVETWQARTD